MTPQKPNFMRAQGTAHKLARRYGFAHPREICLEDIAMERGVLVIPSRMDGCEARLVRKGRNGIIRVNNTIPERGRQRFGVAHDLGHWEMHDSSQWFVCKAADLRDYERSPTEAEANTFASELLMPTHLVRPRCQRVSPSLQAIKSIAEDFDVSLTSAAIRFVRESEHECVLVASKNRQVHWWVRKRERYGVWLSAGQAIDQQSLAWWAYEGEPTAEELEPVPTEAWFPDLPDGVEFEVCEQSMKVGNYNAVLTLLCISDC